MAIKSLTKKEFNSFNSGRLEPIGTIIADEREWYADDAENVLGILIRDKIDNDWAFAILGRDTDEMFKWIDGSVSIADEENGRQQLLQVLEKYEASGRRIFSQSNPDWSN